MLGEHENINDLPNASELTDPLLFGDDTSILYSHSNPNCLEFVLNDELQNIDVWLKCNKLSINIKNNYGTRTASNYQTHLCRTNLKQFHSSLPIS